MSEVKIDRDAFEIEPTCEHNHSRAAFPGERRIDDELLYWRQKLAGIPAILELPTDRPRSAVQTLRTARESVLLPKSLKQALQALSEREGVSPFVVLLAAFQIQLSRYTRQDDIVVGVPIEGCDDDQEPDRSFGVVVIRTDLSGDLAFRQLLSRTSEAEKSAREHANVSWERLVEAVQQEQDASRHPVFQTMFSLEECEISSEVGQTSDPATDACVMGVDLRLQLRDEPEGYAAHFTYNTGLFDPATIVRMGGHFQTLLEGIVVNPDEQIAKLPLLTEAERHQLVVDWNHTEMEYPRNRCVHQLFEAQAVRTPDSIAVVFGRESLTYRELDRRANQLAHHLIKLGAKPDSLVGICLERSLEMVTGLFAILKAGSAYVPIDPAYPCDRVAYMLENSEAPLLLTQAELASNLPIGTAKVVLIDADWPEIAMQSQQPPALALDPENRAYVIYTSGSTGKPKGVEVLHRGVVNFLTTMAKRPGIATGDRLLAVTTLCFDIAGLEIYLPLTQGATLEIVSREVATDGNRLLAKLSTSGTTVMQATPATWRMLLEAGWTGNSRLKILIGGEAVPQKLATQLLQRSGSVWNVYGPTETTIWSTLSKLETGESMVTIGRPIGNTEIFILDNLLQPVPIGVAGELHIGGDGLARGYLKRPELTAERFIAHPLEHDHKARLYKTGDLVRYLPNGDIEFLGRIDHQVKIRGFRIELGEVESVLRQHSRINETVVVAREDTPGDKRVVAYFVPANGAGPTSAELRTFLKEKLPEYMLPSVFVALKSMPLTPNGKVDRRALPAPVHADLASQSTFAAPRDSLESELVQIWETVLGVRPVGVKDNYFELGGHSLLAVKLMNRIEQAFDKTLPIATLLQAPTIEQLAAIVRYRGGTPPWSCLVPIQTTGSKQAFFCIHGINGGVVRFRELSRHLGPDWPFYALQAQGLDAAHECHSRTEDMASLYIREIRSVQPHGPYFLGGYSFGGAIALEMAQQLAAQGEKESVVVLFDTNFPMRNGASLQSTSLALLQFLRAPASQMPHYVWRILTAPKRAVHRRLHVARLPRIVKKVRSACLHAEESYEPQPYSGRMILFRSTHKPLGQVVDPRAEWERYAARGLEICEVPGNHENILLEPQVRFVAERLKSYLDAPQVPLANVLQFKRTVS